MIINNRATTYSTLEMLVVVSIILRVVRKGLVMFLVTRSTSPAVKLEVTSHLSKVFIKASLLVLIMLLRIKVKKTSAISNDQHHLSTRLLLHFNYSYPVVPPSINESSSTNHKDVETSHYKPNLAVDMIDTTNSKTEAENRVMFQIQLQHQTRIKTSARSCIPLEQLKHHIYNVDDPKFHLAMNRMAPCDQIKYHHHSSPSSRQAQVRATKFM